MCDGVVHKRWELAEENGDVEVTIIKWKGWKTLDLILLDDYNAITGMSFLDKVKAIMITHSNILCFLEEGNQCVVKLKRYMNKNHEKLSTSRRVSMGYLAEKVPMTSKEGRSRVVLRRETTKD
ncbi:hypothetical protein NMG60_11014981 [Bertholletia excelsa]